MGIVPAHSTHTVRFTILKPLWLIRENVLSLSLEGDVIVGVIVSRKHSLSMEKHHLLWHWLTACAGIFLNAVNIQNLGPC